MSNKRLPKIYYINGKFSIFNKDDALALREKRIVGQFIGCCPMKPHQIVKSSFPYTLSNYAISVILKHSLACFLRLEERQDTDIERNIAQFDRNVNQITQAARVAFVEKRKHELRKRNIEITEQRIGNFSADKIIIEVANEPDGQLFKSIAMNNSEVERILRVDCDNFEEMKFLVYEDLYRLGFYLSSGIKFGADFLAYFGDPVLYHAKFTVRTYPSSNGFIEVSDIDYLELNALNRVCHAANKIALLAAIYKDSNNFIRIKYWSLKTREILDLDSDSSAFELIDPMKFTSRSSNADMRKDYVPQNKFLKP